VPYEWQKIIISTLEMKRRIKFGVQVLDKDLDEKQKLAVECLQTAIDRKSEK
jgi:hypothetical protein